METDQQAGPATTHDDAAPATTQHQSAVLADHEMECPVCGHPMPDLKGGKATICTVCGFKDSCCF